MSWDPETLLKDQEWMDGLARSLVGQGADDLAQDANLVALQSGRSPGRPWLGGVLRHLSSQRWRRDANRRHREELVARPEGQDDGTAAIERVEAQTAVAEELAHLSEPFRTTLALRYYEGLSVREIAQRQSVPVGTVHSRLSRGIEQMRHRLGRRLGAEAWMPALLPLTQLKSGLPLGKLVGVATLLVVGGAGWRALQAPAVNHEPLSTGASVALAPQSAALPMEPAAIPPVNDPGEPSRRSLVPKRSQASSHPAYSEKVEVDVLVQGEDNDVWHGLAGAELGLEFRWPEEHDWSVSSLGISNASGRLTFPFRELEGLSPLSWEHIESRVFARHAKFGQGRVVVELDDSWPNGQAYADVPCRRDSHILRVVDVSGVPVVGAGVRLLHMLPPSDPHERPGEAGGKSSSGVRILSEGVTDWLGRIAVPNVRPRPLGTDSGPALHWMQLEGVQRAIISVGGISRDFRIPSGQPAENFIWERGLTLAGRLLTPAGDPVGGISTTIALRTKRHGLRSRSGDCRCSQTWTGMTREDGTWSVPGLDPGLYEIYYGLESNEHQTAALPGKAVRSTWEGALLKVRAVDADRLPVRGHSFALLHDEDGTETARTVGPNGLATFHVSPGNTYALQYSMHPDNEKRLEFVRIPEDGGISNQEVMVDARRTTRLRVEVLGNEVSGAIQARILQPDQAVDPIATFEHLRRGTQVLGPIPPRGGLVEFTLHPADRAAGLVPQTSLVEFDVEFDPELAPPIPMPLRTVRGGPVRILLRERASKEAFPRDDQGRLLSWETRARHLGRVVVTATEKGGQVIELHPVIRSATGRGECTPGLGDYWLPGVTETSAESLEEGDWTLHIEGRHILAVERTVTVRAGKTLELAVPYATRGQ